MYAYEQMKATANRRLNSAGQSSTRKYLLLGGVALLCTTMVTTKLLGAGHRRRLAWTRPQTDYFYDKLGLIKGSDFDASARATLGKYRIIDSDVLRIRSSRFKITPATFSPKDFLASLTVSDNLHARFVVHATDNSGAFNSILKKGFNETQNSESLFGRGVYLTPHDGKINGIKMAPAVEHTSLLYGTCKETRKTVRLIVSLVLEEGLRTPTYYTAPFREGYTLECVKCVECKQCKDKVSVSYAGLTLEDRCRGCAGELHSRPQKSGRMKREGCEFCGGDVVVSNETRSPRIQEADEKYNTEWCNDKHCEYLISSRTRTLPVLGLEIPKNYYKNEYPARKGPPVAFEPHLFDLSDATEVLAEELKNARPARPMMVRY